MSLGRGPRTVVMASGSGTNLQAIMDETAAGRLAIELVGVVSEQPAAHALQRARAADVAAIDVDIGNFPDRAEFDIELDNAVSSLAPDLVILAGYMRILADELVLRYAGKMLNIHPSLLPKYPGLDTYAKALSAGDTWHGSTVHFVTPDLDAGPQIIQYRVKVKPGETEESLARRVQRGEYIIYPRAIGWLASGRLTVEDDRVRLDGETLKEPIQVEEQEC